jgi:general L-amino acid transport system permease protein
VSWNDPRIRAVVFQALMAAAVIALGAYLVHNTLINLAHQGIATGFGYLGREASFAIGDTLISYSPASSYGRALLVGLLNTLLVSSLGVVLATLLGVLVGIARLSGNWLVRKFATVYVEILRNVPLLVQLIVWWDVLRATAPPPRQAWQLLPGVFLSNRSLVFPVPVYSPVYFRMAVAFVVAILVIWTVLRWARRRGGGERFPAVPIAVGFTILAPLAVFLAGGAPLALDRPALHGFNFSGGRAVTPEFSALLFGLTTYTAAFIGEIVRSGIEGVGRGQREAAAALGFTKAQALRLVILPQALRIIIPPLISEYLALTKNSSLAVAIGYPELLSITNTTLNQTGQAVEAIALMMAIYLAISLATSLVMNWYNMRVVQVER